MEKGTYGYINAYKKKYGMYSLILALVIVIGVIAVFLIFKTVKHVSIIVPIILSLPFAKLLILWIVVAKFRTMKLEEKEQIESKLKGRRNCILLYDMALSSYESVSYAPCLVIDQGNIYLLWGGSNDKKYDAEKQREYIQGIVEKTGYDFAVYSMQSVEELIQTVTAAPVSEDDLSVKCDRLRQRMRDVCV